MKTTFMLFLLMAITSVNAQVPGVSVTDPQIKYEAERITKEYNKELALNGVQIPLFTNKVAHYLELKQKIEQEYEGKAQLDALVEMQANETLAMNDILTLYQYRLYKKIKSEIQPLKVVAPPMD